jgi:diacylglycerol kinase family enzyme
MNLPDGTATLIANPAAGRAPLLERQLGGIDRLFAARGLGLQVLYTTPEAGSAEGLARAAAARSAIVIACGGDGTMHGVLQGLAHSQTPLGVVPLGTANALARHLGLPLDPLNAVASLLEARPTRIAIGQIETASASRYFLAMAGCGPDGMLAHRLSGEGARRIKRRFGRISYYALAGRLFATRRWPSFRVEYRVDGRWSETVACAALASRLPDLGGLFTGLTRRADFLAPTLHLQAMAPPACVSLPAWFTLGRAGVRHPWQRTIDAEEFRCTAIDGAATYVQADAEPLGPLPFSARIVPDALTLLIPRRAQGKLSP